VQQTQHAAAPSAAAILFNTLLSPGEAMDALTRYPRILPAVAVIILAGLAPVVIAQQRGIIEAGIRQRLTSDPALAQVSPAQRRQILDQASRIGPYSVGAGAVGGPVAGLLAASVVLYGLTFVWVRARPPFPAVCAVVAHAWLPVAVSSVISVPILLARDPAEIDLNNIVTLSNLAFAVPAGHATWYRVAGSLDLFSFWVIGLLILGLSRLTGQPARRVSPVVLAPWVAYVVVFRALLA
jgi:hypothetical protein